MDMCVVCAYEVPSEARGIRSGVTGGCEPLGVNAGILCKTAPILPLSQHLSAQVLVCPPLPPFTTFVADPLSLKQLPLLLPCQVLSITPLLSLDLFKTVLSI